MQGKRDFRPLIVLVLVSAVVAAAISWIRGPAEEGLPELYPMPAFRLQSDRGEAFGRDDVAGKVVVANFIFTRCPTVCPSLTAKMASLQKRILPEEKVHFLSFSVDPKHDTPQVLAEYGKGFDQDPFRWTFLTGDVKEITRAVEEGFKIGMKGADEPDADPFDIVHGEHFVLVDASGTIRGYYSNDPDSMDRLVRDARRLLREVR